MTPLRDEDGDATLVEWTMIVVVAVVFFATLIRSALGFGEALVAVPLLALVIPVEAAVPLAVLVSITIAAVVVAQDWRHVHFRSAGRLVLATLAGIPLGLLLLTMAVEGVVKSLLAIVIITFAVYGLVHRRPVELRDDRHVWLFGFAAGVLGGAYGMNGPPLVVYGTLRRWPPARFRATLQGYFLPASIVGMIGYWIAGLWTPTVTHHFLVCLVPVLMAIALGRALNRGLDHHLFTTLVHAALLAIGAALLTQALWGW